MVETARVVIIGSGGFGAATAYHLAKRGITDVVLLDRHDLGSQTSPRAAGLTSKIVATELMVRLMDEAVEALAGFEKTTGRSIKFMRVGAMRVVLTPEGEARIRHDAALAERLGVEIQYLSGGEAQRLAPYFRAGAARAIVFSPEDGYFYPPLVATGFAAAAADLGVRLRPNTPVTAILHQSGQITGVRTTRGEIRCAAVVDAAGAWAALVGDAVGIRVPLIPTRHQLFITEPIPGIESHHPIIRIHEPSVYTRPEQGGLMLGGYEGAPVQVDMRAQPEEFQIADLPLDIAVLRELSTEVQAHFPVLETVKIHEYRGGLPTISPDGQHIIGPTASLSGFYIASACNVGGLSISPAIGRALADLIVHGACEPDLTPFSIERFRGRFEEEAELRAACRNAYARKYTK